MKQKKIDITPEKRFRTIYNLACAIQDTKLKKIGDMRKIAHEIELLSNTELLNSLNEGIDNFNNGEYITLEELNDVEQKDGE